MSQYAFYINTDDCIGCKTCVVACSDKNNLNAGRKFRRVYISSGGTWRQNGNNYEQPNVFGYSLSISCNHCQSPMCMSVCPKNAIGKRSDGIVYIDEGRCDGCGVCTTACPYGVPSMDLETKKAGKCDMCRDLLTMGEKPACVNACLMRCLDVAPLETLQEKYGIGNNTVYPLPLPSTGPSIVLIPHRKYDTSMTFELVNMPEELQTSEYKA